MCVVLLTMFEKRMLNLKAERGYYSTKTKGMSDITGAPKKLAKSFLVLYRVLRQKKYLQYKAKMEKFHSHEFLRFSVNVRIIDI